MSDSNNNSAGNRQIGDGSMMNPAPAVRVKEARETAAGCRDRANDDLAQAVTMSTANGRQVLEKSAASWSARADMLQRIEAGIEARLEAAAPAAFDLTEAEIAEDAAALRP